MFRRTLTKLVVSKLVKDRDGIVICEAPFHAENNPKPINTNTIATPRRLPDRLNPPPLDWLPHPSDSKGHSRFTKATPRPSAWPLDCALHQANSNCPIEDRGIITMLDINQPFFDETKKCRWLMAAVIDGHSGWQTAEYVSRVLANRVQKSLNEATQPHTAISLSKALCTCFEKMDEEIRAKIEPAFNLGHSGVAKAGATTCATIITPSKIVAANVGDSRAYVCRNGRPIALTNPHNAGNSAEAAKLRDAHPNEEDLIKVNKIKRKDEKNVPQGYWTYLTELIKFGKEVTPTTACYTKGRLQLTRAFGDFYLKDAKFAVDWDQGRLLVKQPHSFPYLSKLPEVSVISREPQADEFVVVASDGVWDELTPQEVCDIVKGELRKGNTLSQAAKKVELIVVEEAAKKAGKSIDEILALPPKQRREHLDDITIALVSLKNEYDTEGHLLS